MNFETLRSILEQNKEQKTVEEDALEKGECPYDGFALKTNSKGKRSCEFCGRIY